MEKQKAMTKGLKKLLIASIIFGVLVLILFFAFPFLAKDTGEPEFASFPEFAKYLFANLANLLVLKYGDPDSFVYFGISIGVYAMLICWLIAVIAGVFVCSERKTTLLVISFPLGLFNCLIYVLLASFSQTYLHVFVGAGGFSDKIVLLILVICTLVFYLAYIIMNIIFYFWAMARCFVSEKDEPKKEEQEQEPKETQKQD